MQHDFDVNKWFWFENSHLFPLCDEIAFQNRNYAIILLHGTFFESQKNKSHGNKKLPFLKPMGREECQLSEYVSLAVILACILTLHCKNKQHLFSKFDYAIILLRTCTT